MLISLGIVGTSSDVDRFPGRGSKFQRDLYGDRPRYGDHLQRWDHGGAFDFSRKKKHRWLIAVINILGGWIYGVPWLISLVWALLRLKTDGSKGFKAWPVALGLLVAPFLFAALGAAIG